MDSLIYPGTGRLWPSRVPDPSRSSTFVDLSTQNELYERNKRTCDYGKSVIYSFIRQMTKYSWPPNYIHNCNLCSYCSEISSTI